MCRPPLLPPKIAPAIFSSTYEALAALEVLEALAALEVLAALEALAGQNH
jgi:hypothetical protein